MKHKAQRGAEGREDERESFDFYFTSAYAVFARNFFEHKI